MAVTRDQLETDQRECAFLREDLADAEEDIAEAEEKIAKLEQDLENLKKHLENSKKHLRELLSAKILFRARLLNAEETLATTQRRFDEDQRRQQNTNTKGPRGSQGPTRQSGRGQHSDRR